MKIQRGIQKVIREKTGYGTGYVSDICNCKKRIDSWSTAKAFAAATRSNPMLWLKGTCGDIQTWLNSLDPEVLKNAV